MINEICEFQKVYLYQDKVHQNIDDKQACMHAGKSKTGTQASRATQIRGQAGVATQANRSHGNRHAGRQAWRHTGRSHADRYAGSQVGA